MTHTFRIPASLEERYEVLRKVSDGGDGATFRVRHKSDGEMRVARVMLTYDPYDENLSLRFRREARLALRLRHPNIVRFYEFGADEKSACFIEELVGGRTLRDILIADGPPDVERAVEIAAQSLMALDYIHERGYCHRGISPECLRVVDSDDGHPLVKLIDLGLAKRLGGGEDLTSAELFLGKALYSAPEQFADEELNLDARCDVYSFGVVFYELLTGQHPNQGHTFRDHFEGHTLHPPRDFAETDNEGRIPDGLRQVVLRSLEKDPAKRIPSAGELLRLLAPFRSGVPVLGS